ncbi:sodium:solute symporter family protein [Pseudodesulfovibrio portus]|uniref:Sodium:solute symporter n=1 Tax=Pseudodesulfovibrio portus TaxID=231439 RepID=A0ABN6RUY9_9BACT|nr:sodium:solute symporter family protein [Pseudodesulfovibrio portus]BDQ34902.1 sodium:solute symporter [Pseudodesulfovibrio portus]
MMIKILVLAAYIVAVLALGMLIRGRVKDSPSEYFLAGRKLGFFVLFGSMAATNFSAFTVFGASGAGYLHGLSFFPIMGFGTGFMALTFWLIGSRVNRLGKLHGLVTPAELIQNLYNNRFLSGLFALIMIVFTIPYLALQPMAGGYVLNQLIGLPQAWGAGIVTLVILLYTLRGGMRTVAWTDTLQGLIMVVMLVLALSMAVSHHGGFGAAMSKALQADPALFSRPGPAGRFGPGIWLSYILLWFFCDPMFPQLFQRFYTARDEKSLERTMLLYPLTCTVVFAIPVLLGVIGRLDFPGLTGKEADAIVPLLMTSIGGDFMGALVLAAGLAALMSTMDSQLLTLSSIFTRDVYPLLPGKKTGTTTVGRIFVCCLALAGYAMAVNPPTSILQIATQTFTGLAVLFPAVFFGVYLKRPRPRPAIASILAGEAVMLYFALAAPAMPVLPVVPVMAATIGTYLLVHLASGAGFSLLRSSTSRKWWPAFGLLFLAAYDFWMWDDDRPFLLGLPLWVWYFVALSGAQTALMWFMNRSRHEEKTPSGATRATKG